MAIVTRWLTRALDYLTGLPPDLECNFGSCGGTAVVRADMTECSRCHAFLPLHDAKILAEGIFCPECTGLTRHFSVGSSIDRIFADIIGYDDLKKEFVKALLSPNPVGILLVGPPGTAKSEFLKKINAAAPEASEFINGGYGSKAGIFDKLYHNRPTYVLVDEVDKLSGPDQVALLNLIASGRLIKNTKTESYDIELKAWVFATANVKENIMEPLFDRFDTYFFSECTDEEFRKIAVSRLRQEGISDDNLTLYIANAVLKTLGKKSFRAAIRIARKCKTVEQVDETIQTMTRYGKHQN